MPHRFIIRRLRRFIFYRVLSLNDTPHRIALGVAIGIFITWTPTIGLQMVLTVALSALFKANKFVGVPFVWLSNPLTIIPIYGPNYLLGCWLLPGSHSWQRFMNAVNRAVFYKGSWLGRISTWWNATWEIFAPLWLGSLLMGLLLGVVTYCLVYWGVVKTRRIYHHRHPETLHEPLPPADRIPPPPESDASDDKP